jgi:hypothetical protein
MTTREAKEKLLLYRGTIDDVDPQFQEALEQARRDPTLARWLREQTHCYSAIRSTLREIEPPPRLAETIIRNRPIPFRREWKKVLQLAAAITISAGVTAAGIEFWHHKNIPPEEGQEVTVRGEVLDMTCYIAYNMSGPEHAADARECIRKGLPVGLKSEKGKVYLLTGKPRHSVNDELADYAAQIVTIKGKETARDGFAQIQVEEVRKF